MLGRRRDRTPALRSFFLLPWRGLPRKITAKPTRALSLIVRKIVLFFFFSQGQAHAGFDALAGDATTTRVGGDHCVMIPRVGLEPGSVGCPPTSNKHKLFVVISCMFGGI
jgi:hypothetical protein